MNSRRTWQRGQTIYLPDGNVPLHPPTLSEGAASLLPDVGRPAVVWTVDLTAAARSRLGRTARRVQSRAKLNYSGSRSNATSTRRPHPSIELLPELGKLLSPGGLDRGAIDLPLPEQDIEPDGDGWRLMLRAPAPSRTTTLRSRS